MADTFLVTVADSVGLNPTTGEAIFFGKANISSAFTLSMGSTDVRGGRNNPLRYKFLHDRDLAINIDQAVFEKTFLALNVGSNVLNQTVNVLKTECITLSSDDGTVTETPVGDINVIKEDGTIITVTPTGKDFTVPSGGDAKVTAIYRYADTVDRVTVGVTEPPSVITLILTAEVRNSNGTLVEQLQIEIPNFQIDGNYELSLSADGVSQESLSGMALASTGVTCADGDVYAYVSWIPVSATAVPVAFIAATPSEFEPAVGDLPATQQITVYGIRGGAYANAIITGDCVFSMSAGSDPDITVNASGLITVAGTATATDAGTVEISYDDGTTVFTDNVLVEVQA